MMKIMKISSWLLLITSITHLQAELITFSQMGDGAQIAINSTNNLTITEECNEITKKILYPSTTTINYNKVLPASSEKYNLNQEVLVEGDKVYIENSLLGKKEMGILESQTDKEVIFTVNNDRAIKYDMERKTLIMKKDCRYKIQNELIYILIVDNLEYLVGINDQTIEQLAQMDLTLSEKIENLASEIGVLRVEEGRLAKLINDKELDWADLLKEKDDLIKEIEELSLSISNISTDFDETLLRAEIEKYKKEISNMDSEITKIQFEIDALIKNYNDNLDELTAKTATLAAIINVSSETELIKVMEQIIIPETSNKQKYNVKHLKGDIMPSKLIRVDE